MTKKEFKQVLDGKRYSYEMEGNKIVVTRKGTVYLNSLTSIPLDMEFKNKGSVYLNSLTSLPPGAVFSNEGEVGLGSLTSLSPGVIFDNGGAIDLGPLKKIPPSVVFNNKGWVNLDWFGSSWEWRGNIKGIGGNRLLNKMISLELFNR